VLGRPVDLDPVTPGIQPDVAAALIDGDGGRSFQQVLPSCEGGSLPCLRVAVDRMSCPMTPSSIALRVEPPYIDRLNTYLQAQIAVE
jgi:hypothetical protein